jgi:hypothetical protein
MKKVINYPLPIATIVLTKKQIDRLNEQILKDLKQGDLKFISEEERLNIVRFLEKNNLAKYGTYWNEYPYDFVLKYNPRDITVYTDDSCNMNYVLHENKRLYFKKTWNKGFIQKYYNSLLIAQDIDSPHRYEYADFEVQPGDTVIDCGVAEGNFALSVIDRAKKVYLFEPDKDWIDALKMTFAPYKEKIVFVEKFVSNIDDEECISLDTALKEEEEIDFFKADIEGFELKAIVGGERILSSRKLKVAITTYHRQNDAEQLEKVLKNKGFTISYSKGFVVCMWDKALTFPYLRKTLIRAVRDENL